MSPLVAQIEHTAALIAAIVPATDPTTRFERIPGDLLHAQEPRTMHRAFDVRFQGVGVTRERFGTSHRQVEAPVWVEVAYDSGHDQRQLTQMLVEDADAIVSALELPAARVNASVQQVTHANTVTARGADDQGEFLRQVMTFSILYVVET